MSIPQVNAPQYLTFGFGRLDWEVRDAKVDWIFLALFCIAVAVNIMVT